MIPEQMEAFLRKALPKQTWHNRLHREGPLAFMEFRINDVDRLNRLGIQPDKLGPHLVVCMWDERDDLEVGGYLVVDNLAMGRPAMGGIRMLPTVTPAVIFNLARGMTLKNAAADLPYGGGKAGIVAPDRDISDEEHRAIVRRFAHLIRRYRSIYLPGPDVGTNDEDMGLIAIENGIDSALSKPVDMGGNRIDELGAAAGGVVIAIDALLEQMPRLKALPQFSNMIVPARAAMTVLIQGFGAVGAHVAEMLHQLDPAPRVVGISDAHGYLYREEGLPVKDLLRLRDEHGLVTFRYFQENLLDKRSPRPETKFANAPNDLLREDAFCFVPAAPVARYLDVEPGRASMTVDRMGHWSMIVEGANTYSPDPKRRAARLRMERIVYWQRGVVIATDFLVNSGGVIFAAQEHLIKTPAHLRFPREILGDARAVERWLRQHRAELAELAAQRLEAGLRQREEVIRRNMQELVDFLVGDPDMLPLEAAEQISITRITQRERFRPIRHIMEPLTLIGPEMSIRQAAQLLVDDPNEMLGVVKDGQLLGVVTDWDITHAIARNLTDTLPVMDIMSRDVITVGPDATIPEVLQLLESHEITAMPVVEHGSVVGVISSHMLARKTLARLLQG
ncbi:MAG TPA: CBS domain-containing protein [Anaerolineae bacterium]|nr:CBS domain-containing protein [Anaerolineae bacterium]